MTNWNRWRHMRSQVNKSITTLATLESIVFSTLPPSSEKNQAVNRPNWKLWRVDPNIDHLPRSSLHARCAVTICFHHNRQAPARTASHPRRLFASSGRGYTIVSRQIQSELGYKRDAGWDKSVEYPLTVKVLYLMLHITGSIVSRKAVIILWIIYLRLNKNINLPTWSFV